MMCWTRTAKSQDSRAARILRLAGAGAIALLFLTGCSREVACDDSEVVDKMLELAKRDVVTDLAGQCASRLYGRIPQVAPQCPKDPDGHTTACVTVCTAWAETHVTAKASAFETLFKDDLVAPPVAVALTSGSTSRSMEGRPSMRESPISLPRKSGALKWY